MEAHGPMQSELPEIESQGGSCQKSSPANAISTFGRSAASLSDSGSPPRSSSRNELIGERNKPPSNRYCSVKDESRQFSKATHTAGSAKVGRTIADLTSVDEIQPAHIENRSQPV